MSKVQVLIVEDELVYADLLAEYLEQLGYEAIGPAASAADALHLFAAHPPDLVLLDVGLRGAVSGLALAPQLTAMRAVPLLFVTAAADRDTFRQARDAGAVAFITKPFTAPTVQNAVELALYQFAQSQRTAPLSAASTAAPAAPWAEDQPLGDSFFLKGLNGLEKVPYADVVYLGAGEKYTTLVLANGRKHLLRMPLREVAHVLTPHGFAQIHRSTAVNLRYLETVDLTAHTLRAGGHSLPVGRAYRDELLPHLKRP